MEQEKRDSQQHQQESQHVFPRVTPVPDHSGYLYVANLHSDPFLIDHEVRDPLKFPDNIPGYSDRLYTGPLPTTPITTGLIATSTVSPDQANRWYAREQISKYGKKPKGPV